MAEEVLKTVGKLTDSELLLAAERVHADAVLQAMISGKPKDWNYANMVASKCQNLRDKIIKDQSGTNVKSKYIENGMSIPC